MLLELVGELDMASAPEVHRVLETVEAERPALVVVDLSGLTFMDSSGLNLLAGAHERQRDAGVRLSIVRGGGQIARLFELTGVESRLPLIESVPDGTWALEPSIETPASPEEFATRAAAMTANGASASAGAAHPGDRRAGS